MLMFSFLLQIVFGLACVVDFFTEFNLARWRVNIVDSKLDAVVDLFFWGGGLGRLIFLKA